MNTHHFLFGKRTFFFFIGACIAINLSAKSFNFCKTTLDKKNFIDTISFEFINNKIILPVSIEGETYRFAFDTGASMFIPKTLVTKNNYRILKTDSVRDASGKREALDFAELREFQLGNLTFTNTPCIVRDLDEDLFCSALFDGLIGSNILKNLIVKIDVENKWLIITDRKEVFKNETGFKKHFISSRKQNIPYIEANFLGKKNANILFDTGDNDFFTLSNQIFNQLYKQGRLKTAILDKTIGVESGGFAGYENESTKYLLKTDDFQLADFHFQNLYFTLTSSRSSRIGADLLNYGKVILDFKKHQFTFIPQESGATVTIPDTKRPSHSFIQKDGLVIVGLIWESSNAYKAGLRKGFILKQINGFPINERCDLLSPLIKEELKKNDMRQLLVVDLEGIEREISFKKEGVD
jgi:predicted aspartyl protease